MLFRLFPATRSPADAAPIANPVSRTAHWKFAPRFVLLNAGLLMYGIALASMIRANIGLAPWDAFHVGMARVVPGLSVGMASIVAGFACQGAAWAWLQMRPGVGSIMNLVLVGVYLDSFLKITPSPSGPLAAWAMFLGGIFVVGLATGTYIASHLGAGPRDSVIIGLQNKTGRSVRLLRTVMEIIVLAGGFFMGAKIGWGTLVYALLVGPSMGVGLGLYGLRR